MSDLREVAVDTEGTGLYPWGGARAFSWGFADAEGWTRYVEFPVNPFTREVLYSKNPKGKKLVEEILADPLIRKIYFNAKYDIRMSEFAGMRHEGPIEEVGFAIKLCGVERPWWRLKPLCKKYLDIPDDDEKWLKEGVSKLRGRAARLGWKLGGVVECDYWMIARAEEIMVEGLKTLKSYQASGKLSQAKQRLRNKKEAWKLTGACETYNIRDCERTITAWLWSKAMMDQLDQWEVYEEEIRELWGVTYAMEARGMNVDLQIVNEGLADCEKQGAEALAELKQLTGRSDYKPGSTKMKNEYFIDELGLMPLGMTKAGNPSIDAAFHEYYEATVPACRETVRFTKATKAKGTYYEWLLDAEHDGGIIHPDMNQFGTKTGRYSGRFHTIPKRLPPGDVMLGVRRSIIPRPNHVLYCADYKQIEARVYADEFHEATLLEAFAEDADPYDRLKDSIIEKTGCPISRAIAKGIFLGKIYGLGVRTLCGTIRDQMATQGEIAEVDLEDASEVLVAFNTAFPGVGDTMKRIQAEVKANGYVINRYGQKVLVDRDFAYRGINYIIQPTAARLMKRAMIKCHKKLQEFGFGHLLLTIHDELIFEFEKKRRPVWAMRELKAEMEDTEGMFPHVTTPVDFEYCPKTWLERKECKW